MKDQLGSMKVPALEPSRTAETSCKRRQIGDSVVFKVAQNQLGIPQVALILHGASMTSAILASLLHRSKIKIVRAICRFHLLGSWKR